MTDPHATGSSAANELLILRRLKIATRALERLASSTEMAGNGETETMTGPAAGEMRCRMGYAREALDEMERQAPKEWADA